MNGQYPYQFDEPWQFTPDDPRINELPDSDVEIQGVPF